MRFLDLAKTRRSVRTFDGKGLDEAVLNELKEYAEDIKNPFGVDISFRFLEAGEHKLSSPVLAGEKYYVSAVARKEPHVEEAYGYSFETLLMRAHEMGLGTVWIGGTMPRDKFEAASQLRDGEIMPCMSPLGVPAKKMSIKESLMRKGVQADRRLRFEDMFFEGDFASPFTEERAAAFSVRDALLSVQCAPSAVNKQPWRVVINVNKAYFYEKHDKGLSAAQYDLQRIDVGIAMYHFEAQLKSEGKTPVVSFEAPAIDVPDKMDYVATYTF